VHADRSVPVLVAKIGRYPLHHGGVGAIRTLGRLGVPVYAVTEDRFTPAAASRYLTGRFVWPTTGAEAPEALVDGLLERGRRIGGRPLLLPTDDEAAVLVAEHAGALAERFLFPLVPPGLPRTLADKARLYEVCRATGTPTPMSAQPGSVDELLAVAAEITYPVVLKNASPWSRLQAPAVAGTTVVHGADDLRSIAGAWGSMPSVLVQEYLAPERAQDWIVATYCAPAPAAALVFTGRKTRSWPPHAGVTTRAFATPNPTLVSMTADLCHQIGYRGIADLDWRFDEADGRYKLVDFNPRVGAQFRLFETVAGVDVVRALHLDLTGRAVPAGAQVDGRRLLVENLDLPAAVAYRRAPRNRVADGTGPVPPGRTDLAWLALDDPLPAVSAAVRSVGPAVALAKRFRRT
jgi:predicted ATP-grasp superfamily ATP-dependent carboligase